VFNLLLFSDNDRGYFHHRSGDDKHCGTDPGSNTGTHSGTNVDDNNHRGSYSWADAGTDAGTDSGANRLLSVSRLHLDVPQQLHESISV
jgi:hypothetical protein